jgi:FecR protein
MSGRSDGRAVRLFLALVSLIVCFAPSIASAQQVVGTVTQLTGSAQIQRGAATIPVAQGTAVELHDRLATALKSTAMVTLTGGSTLTLYYNTSLVFDQAVVTGGAGGNTELHLLEGALRSIVPALVQTQSFQIHTPNAIAAVRGTDFDTSYFEGTVRPGYEGCQRYTDVRVREGVVAVSNLANPAAEVDVEAGFETTVPCLLPPLNAGPLGIAGAEGPGAAGGKGGGGGASESAVSAGAGFSAPPPGSGTSAPPPPPPPMPPLSPVLGP